MSKNRNDRGWGWLRAGLLGLLFAGLMATPAISQDPEYEGDYGPAPEDPDLAPPPPPPQPVRPQRPKPPKAQTRARSATSPEGPPTIRRSIPDQPAGSALNPTSPDAEMAAPIVPPGTMPQVYGVVLGGLDKIAARTAKFEVELGKSVPYNTLTITVHTCRTRPPEEPPESAAYVDVEERKPDGSQAKLFSGWMFASSPALNALEHPIYDVWVVSCKTSKPDVAAPAGPNS